MTEIIRKPTKLYPLPEDLKELDTPHPEIVDARYSRVVLFKEGYVVGSGDNPTVDTPAKSPSNILSKLI